jgi:hypothetical protein
MFERYYKRMNEIDTEENIPVFKMSYFVEGKFSAQRIGFIENLLGRAEVNGIVQTQRILPIKVI